jgi:hypothetical protein
VCKKRGRREGDSPKKQAIVVIGLCNAIGCKPCVSLQLFFLNIKLKNNEEKKPVLENHWKKILKYHIAVDRGDFACPFVKI